MTARLNARHINHNPNCKRLNGVIAACLQAAIHVLHPWKNFLEDAMDTTDPVSMEMLKKAFSLAEKRLSGEKNRFITEVITNEIVNVPGEKIVNDVIAGALCDVFPRSFAVKREHKRIDIGLMNEDGEIVVAIEGKMMVSNSTSRKSYY